jgi:hypothetical protein
MPRYWDWRESGEYDWQAWDELVREDFLARDIDIYPTREDLAAVDERVRDLAESGRPETFRDLWSLLVPDQGLELEDRAERWHTRILAELSWFCLRGGGRGLRVWDPAKLRRHLDRLQALRMGESEHEAEGVNLVWEALCWTDAALCGWEGLMAATGREQAQGALLAALEGLIRARCQNWPRVDIDPIQFGLIDLTKPGGECISFDLGYDYDGRYACYFAYDPTPDQTDYTWGNVIEWSNPGLLEGFTEFLEEVGLDPRPPEWPLGTPSAGS